MFGLFKKTPPVFIGHYLDPKRGYYTEEITPESDGDAKKLAQIADGNIVYLLTHYENGEPTTRMIPASQKQVWLKLKRDHY